MKTRQLNDQRHVLQWRLAILQFPYQARLQPQAQDIKAPNSSLLAIAIAMEHPPSSANVALHKKPATYFKPYDVLNDTTKAGVVGGLSGLFLSSVKNAMAKHNVGILSVFTRGSAIIGLGGMINLVGEIN